MGQQTVAVSTMEAEYMAAAAATKEALWPRKLLPDLGIGTAGTPVEIWGDNQACLKLLGNPISSERSKHIDVIYHFARERALRGEVAFSYLPTNEMVADCLTKAVPEPKLADCMKGM